jgi:hypothetical protein
MLLWRSQASQLNGLLFLRERERTGGAGFATDNIQFQFQRAGMTLPSWSLKLMIYIGPVWFCFIIDDNKSICVRFSVKIVRLTS